MGPRKKSKPNPKADTATSPLAQQTSATIIPLSGDAEITDGSVSAIDQLKIGAKSSTSTHASERVSSLKTQLYPQEPKLDRDLSTLGTVEKQISQPTKSWYGRSWARIPKAAPVTQIAKESISAAGGVAAELVGSAQSRKVNDPNVPLKTPSLYLSRNLASSSRSLPLSATITKVNVSSNNSSHSPRTDGLQEQIHESSPSKWKNKSPEEDSVKSENSPALTNETQIYERKAPDHDSTVLQMGSTPQPSGNDSTSRWLGWFSTNETIQSEQSGPSQLSSELSTDNQLSLDHQSWVVSKDLTVEEDRFRCQRRNSEPSPSTTNPTGEQPRRSWFGLWAGGPTQAKADVAQIISTDTRMNTTPPMDIAGESRITPVLTSDGTSEDPTASQSYGWAFWSRNSSAKSDSKHEPMSNVSQLAVVDSSSHSESGIVKRGGTIDSSKGPSLPAMEANTPQPHFSDLRPTSVVGIGSHDAAVTTMSPSLSAKKPEPAVAQLSKSQNNLLLPPFELTYPHLERPGFLEQLSRLFNYTKTQPKHVSILQDPPRIRKALAIGIHGYFPVPLIRSVLGQPTGTSIKFADSAADAIKKWTEKRGYTCDIEKIALEGEGKIEERVDILWKLMLNWLEDIRKADFILVACHSQGVPVAMMLIAKLIAFGCVNRAVGSETRIAVAAMAGINLGPFVHYKSRWISGSAGELFEFARPESKVSKDYGAALMTALNFGVRIVYIGSIDDQLVSLEVSLNLECLSLCQFSSQLISISLRHLAWLAILTFIGPCSSMVNTISRICEFETLSSIRFVSMITKQMKVSPI